MIFESASNGIGLVDLVFYPGAYNFRHGVELLIKQFSIFCAYENEDASLLYRPGHDLQEQWDHIDEDWLRGLSESLRMSGEDYRVDTIGVVVGLLAATDKHGSLFRYPEFLKVKKKTGERARTPTPVPASQVDLASWLWGSGEMLAIAQACLHVANESAVVQQRHRGHKPKPFQDLVEEHYSVCT